MAHSPDRVWWWNGSTWIPAFSPDHAWWWDGARWQPTGMGSAPVRFAYEPTEWTRRLQWIVLALVAVGFVSSIFIVPVVYSQALTQAMQQSAASQPDLTAAQQAQIQQMMTNFLYGALAFGAVVGVVLYVLQVVGTWKLWRWVYWYFVVTGLLSALAIPDDLLILSGVMPNRYAPPLPLILFGMAFGTIWFVLAVWMIVLYRRYGTWARRRVAVPAEGPASHHS